MQNAHKNFKKEAIYIIFNKYNRFYCNKQNMRYVIVQHFINFCIAKDAFQNTLIF